MTCEALLSRLGYNCHLIGDSGLLVQTPFAFADGEPIHFYLEQGRNEVLVHDNGDTLFHLIGIGMDMRNRNQWKGIKNAVAEFGFMLTDAGMITASAPIALEQRLLTNYTSALLAVADFEREHLGLTEDQKEYVAEVEFYLRANYPLSAFEKNPSVKGHSGKAYNFHFELDGKLVEAIKPHGRTTGTMLRKVMDVANTGEGRKFMAVIDNRVDENRAKIETDILHSVVSVIQFTDLQRDSPSRARH